MSAVQQQMMVLATACDESGKTTGLFIVSAPTPLLAKQAQYEEVGKDGDHFEDCIDTVMVPVDKSEGKGNEKRTIRGILKPAKAISYEALAALPPPIQRSARLSPRELRRLTPYPPSPPASQQLYEKPSRQLRVTFPVDPVITVHDAHSTDEYNRGACEFAARSLTPQLALLIKRELNEVKAEMDVHEESREHTQFYKV